VSGLYPEGVTGREYEFSDLTQAVRMTSAEDCRSCGETSSVFVTVEVEHDAHDERTVIRSWECPVAGCQAANEETVTEETEDPDVDWSAW